MITENIMYAMMLLIMGISIVFIFLGIIYTSIFITNKIFKNKNIKINPDKSIVQNSEEFEEIAALMGALTFLRESRFRYASIPEKERKTYWNTL